MATTMWLAMWLQETDPNGMRHLALIFIVLMAVAICGMALAMLYIGLKALKVLREVGATAAEVKEKFLPLMDEAMAISKTSRAMLDDAAPKVKTISENLRRTSETLVEASGAAKASVLQVQGTIVDANLRTRRQVARVDTMVTAALTTTQEVADTIVNGIRVPAMKLAAMIDQAKTTAEGWMQRAKGMGGTVPFGSTRRRPD